MGSIINSITQHAEIVPNKIAIQEKNQTRTYAQLMDNAQKVATGLKNTELPNKRVAILSKNCIEFIEVFLGAIFSGYVPLLLDTKWSEKEVKSVLRLHKTGIIFGDSTILDTLSTTLVPKKISFQSHSGSMCYEDWLLQRKKTMEQTSHELLFIGFTSGTTGIPKGYNRTHDSWIHSFEASTEIFGINQGDHFIAPGGFTHSLSLFVLIQSLYLGATFHIVPKFQPKHIQALCNRLPNVVLFVVPTMIQSLLTELTYPLHLKALISSGSQWTTEMKAKAAKQFECNQMYDFYGSSEASYISYSRIDENGTPQPSQTTFPNVTVKIVDEHGQQLPDGQTGQICVHSNMLFQGYDQQPEETNAAFQYGWFLTGDYGYLDTESNLYLAGRQKSMIITGGLNVYPEEVEQVIQRIPLVKDVMVFGEQDNHLGEKVVALIAWNTEQSLSAAKVKKFCKQYVATYKIPRKLITVNDFLYTSSGKIARKEMINMMEHEINA